MSMLLVVSELVLVSAVHNFIWHISYADVQSVFKMLSEILGNF